MVFSMLFLIDEDVTSLVLGDTRININDILALFPVGTQENDFIVTILNFIKMLTLPKNNTAYYGLSMYLCLMNRYDIELTSTAQVDSYFRSAERMFSQLNYKPVEFSYLRQFQNWFDSLLISAKEFYNFKVNFASIFFPQELFRESQSAAGGTANENAQNGNEASPPPRLENLTPITEAARTEAKKMPLDESKQQHISVNSNRTSK